MIVAGWIYPPVRIWEKTRVAERRLNVLAGVVSIVALRRNELLMPDPRDESCGYHQGTAPRCTQSSGIPKWECAGCDMAGSMNSAFQIQGHIRAQPRSAAVSRKTGPAAAASQNSPVVGIHLIP